MAEIGKNTVQPIVKRKGQILKTVSSPSTSGSKKQVTNIVLDNGVLKASSDNGDTFEDITVKTAQNAQGAYIKPSTGIPKNDLASAVQTSLGKADTAYQKPSGGIPKNDLAQDVKTSLGKADTALQSVPIATSTKVGGVKPASKTTEMTQPVGVDGNGALWTAPGGGGGITNAEVIEYAEELPTASETSPNFVQTPDGKLYRKKAVEGSGLTGTWRFKSSSEISVTKSEIFNVQFQYNGQSYNSIETQYNVSLPANTRAVTQKVTEYYLIQQKFGEL